MVTLPARSASDGNQRDRGGAAADHHDLLAGVVEVFGPVLGMHDGAAELLDAGEVGGVALVVVVVAAAEEHEAGAVASFVPPSCSTVTVQVSVDESQSAERT